MLTIAAKSPSLQPTAQPTDGSRAAVVSSQPGRSASEAYINVQIDLSQPQSVIKANDMPVIIPGSGNNNKVSPSVSALKPPDLVQKDMINLRRSSRVSKPNRKYINIVPLVKSTLKTFS